MKILISCLLLFQFSNHLFAADSLTISSPDKNIVVTVHYQSELSYSIKYRNRVVLLPSYIDLKLTNGQDLSGDFRVLRKSFRSVNEKIISPVPEKRKEIPDVYNELSLQLKQPFTVILRVYNDGVAYRIVTRFKDSILIKSEIAEFNLPAQKKALLPLFEARNGDPYVTSFEELYQLKQIDSLSEKDMAYSPVLIGADDEYKLAITESDLEDYPGMFLSGANRNSLRGVFAPYPLEEKMTTGEFPQEMVTKRADYIA